MLCGEGARTHGITARSRVGHPKVRLWWLNGNSSGVVITTKASIGSSRISGMQTRMMLAGACWKWRDQKTVSWFLQRFETRSSVRHINSCYCIKGAQ